MKKTRTIEIEITNDWSGVAYTVRNRVTGVILTLGYGKTETEAYTEMRANWRALVIDGVVRNAE